MNLMGTPVTRVMERAAPAPGVSVHFGQYQAVQTDAPVELFGCVHRVLTGHGIDDQQHLMRRNGVLDVLQFTHKTIVDVQASAGVHDGPGQSELGSATHSGNGNAGRCGAGWILGIHGYVQLFAQSLQLGDGCRPAQVGGNHQRAMALTPHLQRQFGRRGGLA